MHDTMKCITARICAWLYIQRGNAASLLGTTGHSAVSAGFLIFPSYCFCCFACLHCIVLCMIFCIYCIIIIMYIVYIIMNDIFCIIIIICDRPRENLP